MRPLSAADPRTIGGHRLLARIGAGGMGVVYLARAEDGGLVALKLIRAEHAADPEFRARFRREAQAAARVDGRFTAPVTAADPEAAEPWIATAFVPGPSLSQVVTAHGPLPARTVRALGSRLAEALTAVHAAGLVHRDIKPANVLLALDGPRLIDFGIARAHGATALTQTDVVIGTPGYLSPEQARGRTEPVGPPSDVFSLGCLLVYAATGRSPFAGHVAAAAVFRAVHEEPDLSAVPDEELRAVLARCLAKPAADRPTAPELRDALAGLGIEDWLPPAVPALIAEASARVLDLPDPEPPRVRVAPEDQAPALAPGTPTRRRFLYLGASAGALAAGAATAALLTRSRSAPPAARPIRTIALHADLSGPGKTVGSAVRDGVALAVDDHNARMDRTFDIALQVHDDAGDRTRAARVARQLVADATVCAVIGPTSDTTALAARDVYNPALLPMVTAWAGSSDLYDTLSSTAPAVFQIRPSNLWLAAPLAHYLAQHVTARRTLLVTDGTDDFPATVAATLETNPPSGDTLTPLDLTAGVDGVASAAVSQRTQALVYCGEDPAHAVQLATALRRKGYSGPCLTGEAVFVPAFLDAAGSAADGWVFVTTFADPTRLPSAAAFVRAFERRHGSSIPHGAAEAYDALGFVSAALTDAGTADRGALAHRLRSQTYRGITKTITLTDLRALATSGTFLWRVTGGKPTYLGRGLSA
jgi:ABC-type branched-subunit amino acid transport system substrate-binding protein